MKQKEKPFVIPVFIPQKGCPHQCVFCNQEKITGVSCHLPNYSEIESEVNKFLGYSKKKPNYVQLAFYGGNFLGLEKTAIEHFMEMSAKLANDGKIHGVRFSTRPDTITKTHLEMLNGIPLSAVELGVQSMDDGVLNASHRGHTSEDSRHAVKLLKSSNFEVGLQMMVGLPGDTEEKALVTTRKIIDLSPDFVRVYPTLVLSKSPLGKWYEKGKYNPLSLWEAISLVKKIWRIFNENHIPVIRMGLQPSEELNKAGTILAGPYHPAFGQLVYSEVFLDHLIHFLSSNTSALSELSIRVNPKNISTARGQKNRNLEILKKQFQLANITVSGERTIGENMMKVNQTMIKLWKA